VLQRLVNERDLGDVVRFLGPLSDAELQAEFAGATVFALPCQEMPDGNRDGIPNTLLEAMAHGIPVVSTTLPSIAEAVDDGVHGLLVPQRDAGAVAAALDQLLGDRSLRERMGLAGRERVAERFDRARCAPRVPAALAGAGLISLP
jgi:glycosyltransferase involved in cell wall biosynthesis